MLQEGSSAQKHRSILLLLCLGVLAADSGKQHCPAAALNSYQVSWQRCAMDLFHPHAPVYCAKSAAWARHGSGNGSVHGMSPALLINKDPAMVSSIRCGCLSAANVVTCLLDNVFFY